MSVESLWGMRAYEPRLKPFAESSCIRSEQKAKRTIHGPVLQCTREHISGCGKRIRESEHKDGYDDTKWRGQCKEDTRE